VTCSLLRICAALLLAGCTSSKDELVVFAASSLQDGFASLAVPFRSAHPGVKVIFNFAGSHELRAQLEHGARADVVASADLAHMRALETSKHAGASTVFVRNEVVFVVSAEAAPTITRAADLASLERISLGSPQTPLGRYTQILLERSRQSELGPTFAEAISAHVVSRELSARQVLARISLGEANAGVVYRTDAMSPSAKLKIVPLPEDLRVVAEYPIAVVTAAPHPDLAREWVDFVHSEQARALLAKAGFDVQAPVP
jgi:molybdate transport system substrate-binding protein